MMVLKQLYNHNPSRMRVSIAGRSEGVPKCITLWIKFFWHLWRTS